MLRAIAATLLLIGVAAPHGAARAEPLEADECKALKSEQKTLLTATVQAALARGPDWVKDNLHDHEKIEQVRQYLQVEEKVAFRCRTNGVRIPKPEPPSLPDRKPPVPTYILAGVAATSLIPLRNPSREAGDAIAAVVPANQGEGEGDIDDDADLGADGKDSLTKAEGEREGGPETAMPATADPKAADPKTADPKTADPNTADPATAQANSAVPAANEPPSTSMAKAESTASSTEGGVSAASEAIAKEEAEIRQGLAKP